MFLVLLLWFDPNSMDIFMAKEVQLNSSDVIVAVTFAAAGAIATTEFCYCFLYKGPPDSCCCTDLVISIQFS